MASEDRGSFDSEWAGFRNEVVRKLDLEFSIRLGLLVSDEGMERPGRTAEAMQEQVASLVASRSDQIGEELFTRARKEGVGFYTYAMYEVYRTSNRLALEVVKSARGDGRNELVGGDLETAVGALQEAGGHWPIC